MCHQCRCQSSLHQLQVLALDNSTVPLSPSLLLPRHLQQFGLPAFAITRLWLSLKSSLTRIALCSPYLCANCMAKRGVALVTIRASRSNGPKVFPPLELWSTCLAR